MALFFMLFKMVVAFKSVTDEIMKYCLFVWSRREQAKVFGQYSTSGAGADISS